MRYANNSNYRNDSLIRKESESSTAPKRIEIEDCLTGDTVCVSSAMIQEIKRIIKESEIIKYAIEIPI